MSANIRFEMKPCPFCGTEVSDSEITLEMDMTGITYIKVNCECGADIMFRSDPQLRAEHWKGTKRQIGLSALDKWNRRAEDATE